VSAHIQRFLFGFHRQSGVKILLKQNQIPRIYVMVMSADCVIATISKDNSVDSSDTFITKTYHVI